MFLKIKEILVLIILVAFIVFINMQTVYVDVPVEDIVDTVYEDEGLFDMAERILSHRPFV